MPCRRLRCRPCLLYLAWRRALGIAATRPQRFLTFTQVGDDWQTVRARMKRVRYEIVDQVGACEWVWSVEPNPAGTGHHVHAWQRGDFLDQSALASIADSKGLGRVTDIRRWHERGGEGYALKGIGYGLKGTEAAAAAATFLEANGARLTHQSRDFFQGGVRSAEDRGVAMARAAGEVKEWQIVRVTDLAAATVPAPRITG